MSQNGNSARLETNDGRVLIEIFNNVLLVYPRRFHFGDACDYYSCDVKRCRSVIDEFNKLSPAEHETLKTFFGDATERSWEYVMSIVKNL